MERLGFDEVKIDGLGNVLGRIGDGAAVIAIDAHLDTVGVGDRSTWTRDPYLGEEHDGVVYGRGAGDQEGGMAAMVYGAAIAKDLGLLGGVQLWVTGTVMEEDCDGLCWQYILREGVLAPDVVVITEPTNLGVYRGQRGRMEIEVRTQGRSATARRRSAASTRSTRWRRSSRTSSGSTSGWPRPPTRSSARAR